MASKESTTHKSKKIHVQPNIEEELRALNLPPTRSSREDILRRAQKLHEFDEQADEAQKLTHAILAIYVDFS